MKKKRAAKGRHTKRRPAAMVAHFKGLSFAVSSLVSQTRSLSRVRFAVSRLGLDRRGCASYKLELSFATRHAMWSNLAAVKALAVRRAALPPDDPEELDD